MGLETSLLELGATVAAAAGLAWLQPSPGLPRGARMVIAIVGVAALVGGSMFPLFRRKRDGGGLHGSLAGGARTYLRAVGMAAVSVVALGGANVVLFDGVSGLEAPGALTIVAATASSWLIGVLAVFVPAGLGVRELAFAELLSTAAPTEAAIAVAVACRAVAIGADALLASLLFVRRRASSTTESTGANER